MIPELGVSEPNTQPGAPQSAGLLEWCEGTAKTPVTIAVRRFTFGPLRVGTTHTIVRNFMGRKMEATNEYIAYEPNERITFKGTSGPVRFEFSYLFESTAEGTKLTGKMQMQATGLLRLAEPLMAASLRREMTAAAGVLKDLLENRAAAISPHPAAR
jgi:hypothetical protein